MSRFSRRSTSLAAGVTLVALLAACGDDDNDASSASTAAEVETPATTEPATTEPATTDPASTEPAAETVACDALPDGAAALSELSVAAAVAEIPELSTLAGALAQVDDVQDKLDGPRPVTLFAPVDEAFAAVDPAVLDAVLADPAQLERVLAHHVVAGLQTAEALGATSALQTQARTSLTFAAEGGALVIDGSAAVSCPDVRTSNGVIHLVDAVLLPPADEAAATTTAAP